MTTTGERLVQLSGLASATAAAHLSSLALGATAGARLVARSSLATGTAIAHLMDQGISRGGDWLIRARRRRRR